MRPSLRLARGGFTTPLDRLLLSARLHRTPDFHDTFASRRPRLDERFQRNAFCDNFASHKRYARFRLLGMNGNRWLSTFSSSSDTASKAKQLESDIETRSAVVAELSKEIAAMEEDITQSVQAFRIQGMSDEEIENLMAESKKKLKAQQAILKTQQAELERVKKRAIQKAQIEDITDVALLREELRKAWAAEEIQREEAEIQREEKVKFRDLVALSAGMSTIRHQYEERNKIIQVALKRAHDEASLSLEREIPGLNDEHDDTRGKATLLEDLLDEIASKTPAIYYYETISKEGRKCARVQRKQVSLPLPVRPTESGRETEHQAFLDAALALMTAREASAERRVTYVSSSRHPTLIARKPDFLILYPRAEGVVEPTMSVSPLEVVIPGEYKTERKDLDFVQMYDLSQALFLLQPWRMTADVLICTAHEVCVMRCTRTDQPPPGLFFSCAFSEWFPLGGISSKGIKVLTHFVRKAMSSTPGFAPRWTMLPNCDVNPDTPLEFVQLLSSRELFARKPPLSAVYEFASGTTRVVVKRVSVREQAGEDQRSLEGLFAIETEVLRRFRDANLGKAAEHITSLVGYDSANFLLMLQPVGERENLREIARRTKNAWELGEMIDALLPLVDALEAIHRAGVVHRDVRPANIIHSKGRFVFIDFGLAAFTPVTGQGYVGVPAYAASMHVDAIVRGQISFEVDYDPSTYRNGRRGAGLHYDSSTDLDSFCKTVWAVVATLLDLHHRTDASTLVHDKKIMAVEAAELGSDKGLRRGSYEHFVNVQRYWNRAVRDWKDSAGEVWSGGSGRERGRFLLTDYEGVRAWMRKLKAYPPQRKWE